MALGRTHFRDPCPKQQLCQLMLNFQRGPLETVSKIFVFPRCHAHLCKVLARAMGIWNSEGEVIS